MIEKIDSQILQNQDNAIPEINGYIWESANTTCAHECIMPMVIAIINSLSIRPEYKKMFDLGCGNGSVTKLFSTQGWDVTGVDPSNEGVQISRDNHPTLKVFQGSAYDDLAKLYGTFPVVISLEVVEHVYSPRLYADTLFSLVEPGGFAVISTPFHGYWKNLALALTGKMGNHFTALWDHGHIKFWSIKTLSTLLEDAGFVDLHFKFVGRFNLLANSMICIANRPSVMRL